MSIHIHVILACHVSIILPEEQKTLDQNKLRRAELKWGSRGVRIKISDLTFYRKPGQILIALTVTSPDLDSIRYELGLNPHPRKLVYHITMFEKLI